MTNSTQSRFGFSSFAETWNGRLAMLGFVVSDTDLTGQLSLVDDGMFSQKCAHSTPSAKR